MSDDGILRYPGGFAAGFIATLVFHQAVLAVLFAVDFVGIQPFPYQATAPLGVPAIWSLAFWGGVWGLVFVAVERWFPKSGGYWAAALVFGALFPSLVAWFVVFPLKGVEMAGGFRLAGLVTGLAVNGAWGLGTGLLLRAFCGRRQLRARHAL